MRMHPLPRTKHRRPPQPCDIEVIAENAHEPVQIVVTHHDLHRSTQRMTFTRQEAHELIRAISAALAANPEPKGRVVPADTMDAATHRFPTSVHWGKGWFQDGYRYIIAPCDEAAIRFADVRGVTHNCVQARDRSNDNWSWLTRLRLAS